MDVDLDRSALAGEVLTVRCETIDDGRVARLRRHLRALLAVVFVYPSGNESGPAVPAFLVVERIDTGAEILRLRSDLRDAPLLLHVQGHLASLTVGKFFEQWGVDLPVVIPAQ
jgi:hypothetical protein